MRNKLAIFWSFLKLEFSVMAQYRIEMALWALWGIAYPAVAIAAWGAAAAAGAEFGSIKGFGAHEFAAYFLLTMIVGHCVAAWDLYEMGAMVQSGSMSPKLMRPVLPVWEHLAANLGFKFLTLALLLPLWVVVALVTKPTANVTLNGLFLGTIATVLGASVNFLWGYALGLSAFWLTRTEGISETWFSAGLFFGGRMAPLTLLPVSLQWVAAVLPFKWVVWFPTSVLMGHLTGIEIVQGLFMQTLWLAGGLCVFPWMWRQSMKRYAAVGG